MTGRWRAAASAIAAALCLGVAAAAQTGLELYRIDPSHTRVVFMVSHVGFSQMIGRFNEVSGRYALDETDPGNSWAEVRIKADSIDTGDGPLDDILRGPEFFNVRNYPEIYFRSTAVQRTGERTAQLVGELTLRGVTKPVIVEVTFNRKGPHPVLGPLGPVVSGFSARMTIDRSEFGMSTLRGLVGEKIKLRIEVEGELQKS
jgi:polyisoprenoid-binding protein YceI